MSWRRPAQLKAQKKLESASPAKAASSALNNVVESDVTPSGKPPPSVAWESTKDETVRVDICETSEVVNGVKTTHTNVKVAIPAENLGLDVPTSSKGCIRASAGASFAGANGPRAGE